MLELQHREMLMDAAARYKITRDLEEFNEAVNLVKSLAPEKFFKTNDPRNPDLALERRVFFNEPFSTFWSGKAINKYVRGSYITEKNI